VRVVAYTLAGGQRSVVTACKLDVEYDDRQEEVSVAFGDNPPVLGTLLAMVEALNRLLADPER